MSRWNIRYGKWWMIQWSFDGWFSIGIHIDTRQRINKRNEKYGPYIDFYLGWFIFSLGINPVYSGEIDLISSVSRGGLNGNII